jgi:hypothetical protein
LILQWFPSMNYTDLLSYTNNSDFLVISDSDLLNSSQNFFIHVSSNGQSFPDTKFLIDHDIFHFAFERGWMHHVYKKRVGESLENFSSYSYHGESIIELFSRFFGNLTENILYIENDKLPKGYYLCLPKEQFGVKDKQPGRIFPISFKVQEDGKFELEDGLCSDVVLGYIRYVIIGSLVTGKVADIFLNHLKINYDSANLWLNRSFFYSNEFKEMVLNYLKNPTQTLPIQLYELNNFLEVDHQTSLSKVVDYCHFSLKLFYTVFINPNFDRIYQNNNSYLFPLYCQDGQLTFMSYLFFLNRSANLVYKCNNLESEGHRFFGFCCVNKEVFRSFW